MSANAFISTLEKHSIPRLRRRALDTVQVNVGKRCNQSCRHCHVDASPFRTESMTAETVDRLLQLIEGSPSVRTVDITGGAPELHPDFRKIVRRTRLSGRQVMDRCNLTVLLEPDQEDTINFLAENTVEIVASLPCYGPDNVDEQRGSGTFNRSIEGLRRLNARGYGKPGSGLTMNLVFNPSGAFLPPNQASLEETYKVRLRQDFGIQFNRLYTITNMPIARFRQDLRKKGILGDYLNLLQTRFNPDSVNALMCTSLVSIDWMGNVYDCDFNQMVDSPAIRPTTTIWDFEDFAEMINIEVATGNHCLGCTAGAGSSCGGALA